MEPWENKERKDKKEQSQNLQRAIEALAGGGFATFKAEALPYGLVNIQCAYLGKSESPKSAPVTK
ncbi:MAG: hypothetical protein LBP74_10780 [Treponema sp.]|nr:hypothetical protein [Treponema sp.]